LLFDFLLLVHSGARVGARTLINIVSRVMLALAAADTELPVRKIREQEICLVPRNRPLDAASFVPLSLRTRGVVSRDLCAFPNSMSLVEMKARGTILV